MRFITTASANPKDLRCSICTPGNHGADQTLKASDGDRVLVHNGYHPVVAGPGYDVYYLNFLAGSARALAVTEDPQACLDSLDVERHRPSPASGERVVAPEKESPCGRPATGATSKRKSKRGNSARTRTSFSERFEESSIIIA